MRDVCKCGHAKDSHFKPIGGFGTVRYNCLAVHCDCKSYVQEDTPSVPPAARTSNATTPGLNKPHTNTQCRCRACIDWEIRRWL